MDNVIRFPERAVRKFGFERATKKKRGRKRQEAHGQLSLFPAMGGDILPLPTGIGLFEEALLLDERGDPGAAAAYRKAIAEGDGVADAYCNLGIMESRAGKTAEAFDCFTSALTNEPRHFESHYNIANLYFDAGDYRLARVHYEIAAQIEPAFANLYFNMGLTRAMEGSYESAAAALTRYRQLDPTGSRDADALLESLRKSTGDN